MNHGLSGIVVAVGVEYWERNGRNDDNDAWINSSKNVLLYGSYNEEYNLK
jgi:hypothetical protein